MLFGNGQRIVGRTRVDEHGFDIQPLRLLAGNAFQHFAQVTRFIQCSDNDADKHGGQRGSLSGCMFSRKRGCMCAYTARISSTPTALAANMRSEERRVGKEGVSTCKSRWSPSH